MLALLTSCRGRARTGDPAVRAAALLLLLLRLRLRLPRHHGVPIPVEISARQGRGVHGRPPVGRLGVQGRVLAEVDAQRRRQVPQVARRVSPLQEIRRVDASRGIHKLVVRFDDHLTGRCQIHAGRRPRVALQEVNGQRQVVLLALVVHRGSPFQLQNFHVVSVVVRKSRDGDGEGREFANRVEHMLPHAVLHLLLVRQRVRTALRKHLPQVVLKFGELLLLRVAGVARAPAPLTRVPHRRSRLVAHVGPHSSEWLSVRVPVPLGGAPMRLLLILIHRRRPLLVAGLWVRVRPSPRRVPPSPVHTSRSVASPPASLEEAETHSEKKGREA
mmetsp:Transcript_13868/g.31734  ORF Transcript_13868/g.31734 Transcript_13868/m.31734 type:complete len:330 (-) Transcript_13868:65-1054(-)